MLTIDDVCRKCVTKMFEGESDDTRSAYHTQLHQNPLEKSYQIKHPHLVSSFDEACDADGDMLAFWISKAWLRGACPMTQTLVPVNLI